jgi:hypothetical protein
MRGVKVTASFVCFRVLNIVILAYLPLPLFAAASGSLSGRVKDPSGAVISLDYRMEHRGDDPASTPVFQ